VANFYGRHGDRSRIIFFLKLDLDLENNRSCFSTMRTIVTYRRYRYHNKNLPNAARGYDTLYLSGKLKDLTYKERICKFKI
jgi:hypothetical protein